MKKYLLLLLTIILKLALTPVFSQNLKPYFDKEEYRELLYISAKTNTPDSVVFNKHQRYNTKYRKFVG